MLSIHNDFYFLILKQHFPKLAMGVEIRWGTVDLEPYIMDLLNDTRGHTRKGFPTMIAEALNSLLLVHGQLYPEKSTQCSDPWNTTFGDI